jgi:hypothetical protein
MHELANTSSEVFVITQEMIVCLIHQRRSMLQEEGLSRSDAETRVICDLELDPAVAAVIFQHPCGQ